MKKTLSLMLAALLFILCACGNKAAPVLVPESSAAVPEPSEEKEEPVSALSFYTDIQFYEKKDGDTLLCRVDYPVLKLETSDAESFPLLKKAIDNINNAFIRNGKSSFEQLSPAAESSYAADSKGFETLRRSTSLVLPRADSLAVSMLFPSVFSDGAGEDVSYSSVNCDTRTGREIELRHVVKDLPQLREIIETLLPQKYPRVEFSDLMGSLNRYMDDPGLFVWTLEYEGITLFFNPYELAGAEAGLLSLSLRYDNYPELLEQSYARTPPAFSVPLVDGCCPNFDLDLNGASDEIRVTADYNEALGYADVLRISVNGNEISTKTGLRSCDCYVIHAGLGRDYLFINGENLSDYGYINVFRLSRTGASFVGGLYDTSLQSAGFSGHCLGKPILSDPERFYLGSKCPLLRTQVGIKQYRIGSEGMPESADKYFLLDPSEALSGKRELSTVSIDPNTGSGSQIAVKIPAGTQYYFWRTDGTSFVDMMTGDGVYCRLFVTNGNPQRVNGIEISELFDSAV